MGKVRLFDMRHDFCLTVPQVNSAMYVWEELIIEQTRNTNLVTVDDLGEYFAISIWVLKVTEFNGQ